MPPALICIGIPLLALSAIAQTADVKVTPRNGTPPKVWTFTLTDKVLISRFACDKAELTPGESSTCTVTLNVLARLGGFLFDVVLPPGFTGPATVLVGMNSSAVDFTVTRVELTAAVLRPSAMMAWSPSTSAPVVSRLELITAPGR